MLSLQALGENPSLPLAASEWLSVFLGLWQRSYQHLPYVSVYPFCFFKDTLIGFMSHAKSVWSLLDSCLIFLCKAFISKAAYILRFWEDMNFRGTNTF